MKRALVLVSVALGLCGAPAVQAQTQEEATALDDVVVIARRSGAPIWEVTRGGGTVILVGEIVNVPEATPWSAAALEGATARSQRVMSGIGVRGSVSDLFRLMWRARTLTRLPDGTTSADHLAPEWQARLSALEDRHDRDYSRDSFLIASQKLLRDDLRFNRDTADDAGDVVRRAARKARIPVRSVQGDVQGNELLEGLLTQPPSAQLPCMQAAIRAAEAGPDAVLARGRAWTRFEVAEVMASPIEQALGQCWPWGDPTLGPQLKTAWVTAIETALTEPGVTMAVAPLGLLAESGGALDRLEAQGAVIDGPAWK